MPTAAEKNQFRRLIGDFESSTVNDSTVDSYLNDATSELTADFVNSENEPAPVADFDDLHIQYHPEVIYYAAINYLWNRLAKLSERHTQTVGQSSQNASEKFDRVYQMIEYLTESYGKISQLGTDITIGNISRFSKNSLMRVGGQREEDALEE